MPEAWFLVALLGEGHKNNGKIFIFNFPQHCLKPALFKNVLLPLLP